MVRRYVRSREQAPKPAYDLTNDPSFVQRWYEHARAIVSDRDLALPTDPSGFLAFVGALIDTFEHWVEEQDGWRTITGRAEREVQSIFRGVVWLTSRMANIDLTGESNAGRGPVDFKFSQGWRARALVEMKLARNSRFWHGVAAQTPQYLRTEQIRCGYFVAIGFTDQDFEGQRFDALKDAARSASEASAVEITPVVIDARPKRSVSKR